ncbi:MAG: hypothetical protein J1E85_01840, partial [Ruminococcus sp.]|nr:hypothetical protein [Ruminococcus sp.]
QVKFAANGDWGDNWGGTFAGMDVETDAVYDGDNITAVIGEGDDDENLYTVTLTFDLTGFNFSSKTGAKFTISQQVQDDEPATTEPEPTSVPEPTSDPDVPTPADTYIVAGSEEVFGANWDGKAEANTMTEVDGIYTLTIANVAPITNAQFKIVKNGKEWIGDGEFNFAFNVVSTCDVTITYNPATGEVKVIGDGVTPVTFEVESIRAVGNGGAGWLNDVNWNPAADENFMEEISDGVYQLVMVDVEGNDNAQVKFAANGDWGDNWGGTFEGMDVETDAVYNGDNITAVIGEGDDDLNLYTVTLTLDLTGFNYSSKIGAKFTISQQVQDEDDPTPNPGEEDYLFYVKTSLAWIGDYGANLYVYDTESGESLELDLDTDAYPIVYVTEVPGDMTSCIIYRHSNELSDPSSAWNSWAVSGISSTNNCVTILGDTEITVGPYEEETKPAFELSRVYFDNSNSKWSSVYVYGWTGSGLSNTTAAMTNIAGTDIWYYDFATPLSPGAKCFLFKDTEGGSSWVNQSNDITVVDGMNCWVQTPGSKNGSWKTYSE